LGFSARHAPRHGRDLNATAYLLSPPSEHPTPGKSLLCHRTAYCGREEAHGPGCRTGTAATAGNAIAIAIAKAATHKLRPGSWQKSNQASMTASIITTLAEISRLQVLILSFANPLPSLLMRENTCGFADGDSKERMPKSVTVPKADYIYTTFGF
jgi:hypothetical protein